MAVYSQSALLAQIAALVANSDINIATGDVFGNVVQSTYQTQTVFFTAEGAQYTGLDTTPIQIVPGIPNTPIIINSVHYVKTAFGTITQAGSVGLCYGVAGGVIYPVVDPTVNEDVVQRATESTGYKFQIGEGIYFRATDAGTASANKGIGIIVNYSFISLL
jgi:hypothetical protein